MKTGGEIDQASKYLNSCVKNSNHGHGKFAAYTRHFIL